MIRIRFQRNATDWFRYPAGRLAVHRISGLAVYGYRISGLRVFQKFVIKPFRIAFSCSQRLAGQILKGTYCECTVYSARYPAFLIPHPVFGRIAGCHILYPNIKKIRLSLSHACSLAQWQSLYDSMNFSSGQADYLSCKC